MSQENEWEDRPSCWMSKAPQCTPHWDRLHIGTVSASHLATYLGVSRFSDSPEEAARQCVGLSQKTFNSEQLDRTRLGIEGEPVIRDWYAEMLGKPIRQVGLAVWKRDPRFRASLDGEFDDKAIEIKVSAKIYKPLVQHIQAVNRGYHPPPWSHTHIWDSHYLQMTQSMAVTGKEVIDYLVAGYETNEVYIERLAFNACLWDEDLYPRGVHFLETYVEPLMRQHQIQRLDPPGLHL